MVWLDSILVTLESCSSVKTDRISLISLLESLTSVREISPSGFPLDGRPFFVHKKKTLNASAEITTSLLLEQNDLEFLIMDSIFGC